MEKQGTITLVNSSEPKKALNDGDQYNGAQPTNPVECVQSLTQKHVAKRYMIGEKFLPLRHES